MNLRNMNCFISLCKYRIFPHLTFGTVNYRNVIYCKTFVNEFYRSPTKVMDYRNMTYCVGNVNKIKAVPTFSKGFLSTSALNVNTNVAKDVIIYRYENPKFFRIVNIFALCQFGFWTYLAHFAFTSLRDAPVPKDRDDLPWWRRINFGENKYRNGLSIISFLIGYGILTSAWLFTLKSVRFLILRKGGDQLTFVTYTPFGKNRMLTVPVNKVSSQESRQNARVQLPIKVKNHRLFYVLDMKGQFTNPKLFDHTAGLRREWKT